MSSELKVTRLDHYHKLQRRKKQRAPCEPMISVTLDENVNYEICSSFGCEKLVRKINNGKQWVSVNRYRQW